ncbi:cation diffusion facilitator family transporter [Thermophilibacter provencensis]|uniref:Cation diffusion facilitator family transporter n=1 Tax=Thermophilibacter provencensis TaxID=1852386 RepID=A0A921GHL2_9ACTN|nr:cation diffusion facilitator family transporter [Thermophilibacter provencensis]HJF45268.1 cation diffusion facilitator family transporter [Thermophilibacter provencensis]
MTGWLIRTFVPNAEDTGDPTVRTRYGLVASVTCIVCNALLCLGKGAVGVVAGSVSIVADAVNNLSDASSNVVSLLGFKLASRPADEDHPYGHGRYEYLAGLVVAVLVCAIGINLVMSSANKIAHPEPTEFGPAVVAVLVLSMAVKLWMATFNRRLGRAISSETLEATAVDSRNDVIATAAVLASAVVSQLVGIDLDGWAGLAVGGFILWSGIQLVREAVSPLLGKVPDPAYVEHIRDKIMSYPGVLGTHDLMVHDYGPGRQFASAHVEMAAEGNPLDQHDLLDNIEQDFKDDEGLVMTLHFDPIVTNDPQVRDMRHWIDLAVKDIDERLSIHDLRCVPGPTHTNVIFDCVRPTDCALSASELRARVSELVRDHYPRAVCKITVDESYVSSRQ